MKQLTHVLRPMEIVSGCGWAGWRQRRPPSPLPMGQAATIFGPRRRLDGEGVHDWQAFFWRRCGCRNRATWWHPHGHRPVVTITLSNPAAPRAWAPSRWGASSASA